MVKPVRVALLGCGVVGGGVAELLRENGEALAERVGAPLELAHVLVRDPARARAASVDPRRVTTDPEGVLGDGTVDVFVEVMGGVDPARAYVERALASGRGVVTANKMLLAVHGADLLDRARAAGVDLAFEASVGGGIPIVRVLREALAGDRVEAVSGIVNGTCNYVLTKMRVEGLSFDAAVKEAQALGYAEADPGLDVDGHDAAHKLVVLAMLAFGARVDGATVPTEGIRDVAPIDHRFADRFGFAIKHLAIGRDRAVLARAGAAPRPVADSGMVGGSVPPGARIPEPEDALELRVHPALVRRDSTLANVNGVLNAVAVDGASLGPCLLSGRGAGALPTAVSVVADLADVARALRQGAKGLATRHLRPTPRPVASLDWVEARYYLRFEVYDHPGVLARITGALGRQRVSIEQMVQEGGGNAAGTFVQVVLLTHLARERDVRRALAEIGACDFVAAPTKVLRVHE